MAIINDLPNELLWYLFRKISPNDIKNAVLVSRRWGKVGDDPVLWDWCFIKIANIEDINKLFVVRFNHVQRISVTQPVSWLTVRIEKLFEATLQLPKLKKIHGMWDLDVRAVNTELFVKVLAKLELLRLTDDWITNEQKLAIFRQMSENSCVKYLSLARIDLSTLELDAELLAETMSSMQKLSLDHVSLSNDQAQRLFKSISQNNHLSYFSFDGLDLLSVEPEVFGKALANIEHIGLDDVKMSSGQAQAFFREMGRNSRIQTFHSIGGDLSLVEPNLLAKGLSNLEEIRLVGNSFTDEQVMELFAELSRNSKLKVLDLAGNNLWKADPDDLADAVSKGVLEVDLTDTNLDTWQLNSVLMGAQENTKLEKLAMSMNQMSQVDPSEIADVVVKLKDVDLRDTYLRIEQINAILMKAQENSKIEKLDISENNLSEVDPDNLANFVAKIEDVNMYDTQLSTEQINAIFTHIDTNTKLKKLSITRNNVSEVDPNIITRVKKIIDVLDINWYPETESDEEDDEDGLRNESDNDNYF